jgi:anionic cell wall polymer biosynthesis LytR-Cps2A-Psr (LCP) family protein
MMCPDQQVSSPQAWSEIFAGCQPFDGRAALAYARDGDGGQPPASQDSAQTARQQQLLAAVAAKARQAASIRSLPTLYRFTHAVARSLSTSQNLGSLQALGGLALALRGVSLTRVEYATVPYELAGDDANVVLGPGAQGLFDAIAEDRPLVGATPAPTSK